MAYLDHAATTPILAEAREAMNAAMGVCGNASSLHSAGRRARRVAEESRESVAAALGARPGEVVFTAGGTEADNLGVKGLYWSRHAADPRRRVILASPVEHHAVLDPVCWLRDHQGAVVRWLGVDSHGRIDPDQVDRLLAEDAGRVALVTVMWANNEVGTVQPVEVVVAVAHRYGVPVHVDAVAALGQLSVDATISGADTLAVSAHKIGGPIGVGALVVRSDAELTPVLHGGGQEAGIRSGTLDVPGIAGFAVAAQLAHDRRDRLAERLAGLRDSLVDGVRGVDPSSLLNGDPGPGPASRLPGNAHLTFPGAGGDSLLMLLDAAGVECSTGSACSAGVPQASHVLLAMGVDEQAALCSVRFSLGHSSTATDVQELVTALPAALDRARRAGVSSARLVRR